jgi:hypothetical protein
MTSLLHWFNPARYPWLVLPAFWLIMFLITSVMSGWFTLANRFRKVSEPVGETRTTKSSFDPVTMRFRSNYGGMIRLTAAEDALYLSVFILFRFGHPPLRIPWNEIEFSTCKYFSRDYVVLTLGKEEHIPLRITPRMATKLGILDRVPGGASLDAEPNFDNLPDDFMNPSAKKSD